MRWKDLSFKFRASTLLVALSSCTPIQKKADPSEKPTTEDSPSASPKAVVAPPSPPEAFSRQIPPALSGLDSLDFVPKWGENAAAQGSGGVVTSVEQQATRVGVGILEAGGNAVDAAVATAFALAVTHPSAGNLGGGGFLILRLGSKIEGIDFRENSPADLNDERFWKMIGKGGKGPVSVGVPGTVAGLHLAHSRHGKLPWGVVVAPSERLARDGFQLGVRQANTIRWASPELARDPSARRLFFDEEKRPLTAGSLVKNPGLAIALKRVREQGPSGFYDGPTAKDLLETIGPRGLMRRSDLQNYRAKLRDPLHLDFGPFRVVTMPAPSAGGVALAQNLLMLQRVKVEQTEPESAARYHLIAEASRRSQIERQLFVSSPDELSEQQRATARARALSPNTWLEKHPISPNHSTDPSTLHPKYKQALAEKEHTTHFSVIDREGGMVSCTVTLSGSFGAKVVTRETGIVLNNSVASFSSMGVNTPQPGARTTSSMAPTLALLKDGNGLVLGSPGGDTIPNTVTQTFLRLALDNRSLGEAVAFPRIHQPFAPNELALERFAPLPRATQNTLEKMGHRTRLVRYTQGDANIAARFNGRNFAVADKREGGLALAEKTRPAAEDSN